MSAKGPRSNLCCRTGGQLDSTTLSSSPHLLSRATPGGWMKCVDRLSLGKAALSSSNTR